VATIEMLTFKLNIAPVLNNKKKKKENYTKKKQKYQKKTHFI
jgi:hypothetical protein